VELKAQVFPDRFLLINIDLSVDNLFQRGLGSGDIHLLFLYFGGIQQVLNELAGAHGINPQQPLYVGNDMLKDIWPAARLGCKTALFAGDRRSLRLREDDERCRELEPDLVVDDLSQLAQF